MDLDEINNIIQSNTQKNFVRRIMFPEGKPKLDLGNGQVATHKMAWGEADGKYYVFPTVMQEEDGTLKDYGDDAFHEAMKRREFIRFDDPEKASQFSEQYKDYWKSIGYKP